MEIIEEFIGKAYLVPYYKKMSFGIALKSIEISSTEALQKPSSLKDVNLNNIYFDSKLDF